MLTGEVASVGGTAVLGTVLVVLLVLLVLVVVVGSSVVPSSGWWPGFCQTDTSEGPIDGKRASRTAHAAPEVPTMMPNHKATMTSRCDERRLDPVVAAGAVN